MAPTSAATAADVSVVVGGVVGRHKFLYDLWGDTVAIASRLATQGDSTIHVTKQVYDRLSDLYSFDGPFDVELRGQGTVKTWLLRRSVKA